MRAPNRSIPPLTPQDTLHFWSKVDVRGPDECWPWRAGRDHKGYGRFALGSRTDDSHAAFLAHRIAWTLCRGPIPADLCVLHHCDNPPCCNPAHGFLGSLADNAYDAAQKGRMANGDRSGTHTHPELYRGERNSNAKLTDTKVLEIRRRAAEGENQHALGREIGVSHSVICRVVNHKAWTHVA